MVYSRLKKLSKALSLLGLARAAEETAKLASYEGTIVMDPPGGDVRIESAPVGPSNQMYNILMAIGAKPLRYVGGPNAALSGQDSGAVPSKYGEIYVVMHNGKLSVAKIVSSSDNEPEVWRKIAGLSLSSESKRHLPEIRGIEAVGDFSVILMERLAPIEWGEKVFMALNAPSPQTRKKEMTHNTDFIHNILNKTFEDTIKEMIAETYNEKMRKEREAIRIIAEDGSLVRNLESSLFSLKIGLFDISPDILGRAIASSDTVVENRLFLPEHRSVSKEVFEEFIASFLSNLKKYTDIHSRYIPKHHSLPLGTNNDGRHGHLYADGPEKYLFSEEYKPETKGIMRAALELRDNGILWRDMHANNIMQRIEKNSHGDVGDLVIIDVGLYGINKIT